MRTHPFSLVANQAKGAMGFTIRLRVSPVERMLGDMLAQFEGGMVK
ncbi:MAG: hypothetical protein JNL18_10050 [Planctomycetaceae bacterium]|uniref:Uncharacterized protein n=1 Tax=Lacipirellula limnantheis TaxID=2528024 RepID=A0A517U517_9BACT|nr:hypothetical protein [Lacipirellula limnantheis]MBL9163065.1 hypothetical protein [Planctomycetaceae bacterium]QDT75712.1 hypothetical protein I41_49540 [Lacipirellula limnantheis]